MDKKNKGSIGQEYGTYDWDSKEVEVSHEYNKCREIHNRKLQKPERVSGNHWQTGLR